MNGVAHDRQTRGRLFYVANPDSDEPRSPVAPLPVQPPVRLLPPITTAPSVQHNVVSQSKHIPSSGSSSDRSSPSFNTSASSPSPITPDSPTPTETLSRHNLLVMVTNDGSSWWAVDLSDATTGASIREMIYSKVCTSSSCVAHGLNRLLIVTVVSQLKIPDEDHDITVIYRGHIQRGRMGDALNDSSLLSMCEQFGDSEGNLRFALETTSFPRSSAVQPPPSPSDLSLPPPLSRLRSGEVQIRDHSFDGLGGYEASDEGSSKRSAVHPGTRVAVANLCSHVSYCNSWEFSYPIQDIRNIQDVTSRTRLPLPSLNHQALAIGKARLHYHHMREHPAPARNRHHGRLALFPKSRRRLEVPTHGHLPIRMLLRFHSHREVGLGVLPKPWVHPPLDCLSRDPHPVKDPVHQLIGKPPLHLRLPPPPPPPWTLR
jgi:hypothetical protein